MQFIKFCLKQLKLIKHGILLEFVYPSVYYSLYKGYFCVITTPSLGRYLPNQSPWKQNLKFLIKEQLNSLPPFLVLFFHFPLNLFVKMKLNGELPFQLQEGRFMLIGFAAEHHWKWCQNLCCTGYTNNCHYGLLR